MAGSVAHGAQGGVKAHRRRRGAGWRGEEETGIAVGWGVERDESGGTWGTEGCRVEAEAVRGRR